MKIKQVLFLTLIFNVEGYILNKLIGLLSLLISLVIKAAFLMEKIDTRLKSMLRMPALTKALSTP